jgi:hypothetical protein
MQTSSKLVFLIIILGAFSKFSSIFFLVTSLPYVFYYPIYFLLYFMFSTNTRFSPLFLHTLWITLLHKGFWLYSIELQFDELIGCKDFIHFWYLWFYLWRIKGIFHTQNIILKCHPF